MKNLFIVLLCLACVQFATSQERILDAPIEGEYMEVRFVPMQGLSFRLAPDLPFEKAGMFNKNLRPYFKQYDESLRYHKQYNRSFLLLTGSATLYGLGSSAVIIGGLSNNPNIARAGGVAFVAGIGLTFWANYVNGTSTYKAVDAYNRNVNPNLKDVEYFEAVPHPYTMWQFRANPMADYKTVGLYGNKIKPYVEQNEAAYDAYKKYRTGHMTYSLGNIVSLVGTGMMLDGVFSNNSDLSRNGLIASAGGVIAIFVGSSAMNKNIYQTMDLMNYHKSPILNSSLIPSIQPSSHSAGLALVWDIE